jgi:hypothetical protein
MKLRPGGGIGSNGHTANHGDCNMLPNGAKPKESSAKKNSTNTPDLILGWLSVET